jgi:hypothetical protein
MLNLKRLRRYDQTIQPNQIILTLKRKLLALLLARVKIIRVDQSAVGKLMYCTNRKVPMKISRWRFLPMRGGDRWKDCLLT